MSSIKSYCQLCAELKSRDKLKDLLAEEGKIEQIVIKLTRLKVAPDFTENKMPKTVCIVCLEALDIAYNFVTTVEQAQITINEVLFLQSEVDDYIDTQNLDNVSNSIEVKTLEIENSVAPPEEKDPYLCSFNVSPKKIEVNIEPDRDSKDTWASYSWLCKYCDTQFSNVNELITHSMKYHSSCNPFCCQQCISRKDSLNRFLVHIKKHQEHLKFSCHICFRKYTTSINVQDHYKIEHEETDYTCPGCNLYFENDKELNQHINKYWKRTYNHQNLQAKSLTCIHCDRNFKNRSSLRYHNITAHSQRKKDFICDQCGKCFYNKNSLKTHLLLHNSDKPFKCEICKTTFKTSTQLRNHFIIHNLDKPYKCVSCGRGFRLKKQLKSHEIVHTDSLPYKCSHCNKQFRFRSVLVSHERIHLGVKPYSCDDCQKDFTNWSNFNKHMKRKHDKNMAKEKNTLKGLDVDPKTGELCMKPEAAEWWNKMTQQKPGRPEKGCINN